MIILKKSHRRMVTVLAICVLCFSAFCATTSKAKAKAYWMTGTAGQSSLYYTGEKFDMSGEWGKGATLEKSAKVLWNNPKEVSSSFKKGKAIRTGSIGSDGLMYDAEPRLSKGEQVGITVSVKIKGKRIVEVVYSAM